MQGVSPEFEAAVTAPVDNAEHYAQALERLARDVRRHGLVDGELGTTAEQEELDPIEFDGVKYRNCRPTGRYTYVMNLVIDRNQVR
jgi:hypothetical protein